MTLYYLPFKIIVCSILLHLVLKMNPNILQWSANEREKFELVRNILKIELEGIFSYTK
jgi:hypothetical protein